MAEWKLAEVEQGMIGEIWTSREMRKTLDDLCLNWPNRFSGTPAEREAAGYLLEKMRSYGLDNVHMEEFSYQGWRRGKDPSLTVLGPGQRSFACSTMSNSPAGDVTGRVVDVGSGSLDDFEIVSEKLKDNIALLSVSFPAYKRTMPARERMELAAQYGAKGVIWRVGRGGHLTPGGTIGPSDQGPAPIPAVGISREDAYILTHLASGADAPLVRLTTHCEIAPMVGYNSIGEITGSRWPGKLLLASAHYDSIEISPGANDNAMGVASILEIARVLAKRREHLGKTLRFIFFSVEELGLLGAFRYVQAHAAELGDIEVIINLDDPAGELENGLAVQGWPDAVKYLRALRSEMNESFPVDIRMKAASDHYPFALAGVPAVSIDPLDAPSDGGSFGHTPAETPDKVPTLKMRLMAIMIGRIMLRLAGRDDWPARRKSRAEIVKYLERDGLREMLEKAGRLPAAP